MSWDTYVHQIQNQFDPATNAWAVTNVCQFACVYGHDGAVWATSEGFQLATYEFDMPTEAMDGTTTKVLCNEHQAMMKAAAGTRNGGQQCGLRICNQKYMFLKADTRDGVKFATLSRQGGGGALVALTKQCLLVGVWSKDADMSTGMKQNIGDCEKQVMGVAKQLADAGY